MTWLIMTALVVLLAIALERGWYWYDEALARSREIRRLRRLIADRIEWGPEA